MQRRLVVAITGVLAAATLAAGRAQTPQQRPIFRAGSVLVNVDVYPRRDGKVVEGLTKGDFEVFEDGKAQAVDAFEFIRVAPSTPEAERREPTSISDGYRQAADPHNRVFVIYLDIFHTTIAGSHYARTPILTFLDRTLGPNDLFAVMTPEIPGTQLTFTRKTGTLSDELARKWDWGEAGRAVMDRNDLERKLHMCGLNYYGSADAGEALVLAHREELSASALEDLVVRLQNIRDERKNIIFVSEGWDARPGRFPGTSSSKYPTMPQVGVGPGGKLGIGASMSNDTNRAWCEMQKERLAQVDYDRRFKSLLETARRANVAFYPVDVGGLRTTGLPASEKGNIVAAETYRASVIGRIDLLMTLAHETDGEAIVNTNDLTGAIRGISDDLSAFYLLTYYSTNTDTDGRFRRIDVKVKSPGLRVSARRGYLAPTPEMRKAELAAAARPATGPSPVDEALGGLSKLRADAKLYSAAVHSASGLDVTVELAGQEVEAARWPNGARVTVTASARQGGVTPTVAEGRIEPGARGVSIKVPLATASPAGWRIQSRIEGPDGPIEDEIAVSAGAPALVGEPAVFRGGPGLKSPLRPAAEYRFRRTERVHVEWTLPKPLGDRSARLLNRRGDALAIPVTVTEREDGGRLVLAADFALAPLADGDYVIEMIGTLAGDKVHKLLAIRVVR
jgi:VWFA-related protein